MRFGTKGRECRSFEDTNYFFGRNIEDLSVKMPLQMDGGSVRILKG